LKTLIDDCWGSKENGTREVNPHGGENRMICEKGNVEAIQTVRRADEDAYPDLLTDGT
jgi:hypothetical protein